MLNHGFGLMGGLGDDGSLMLNKAAQQAKTAPVPAVPVAPPRVTIAQMLDEKEQELTRQLGLVLVQRAQAKKLGIEDVLVDDLRALVW